MKINIHALTPKAMQRSARSEFLNVPSVFGARPLILIVRPTSKLALQQGGKFAELGVDS